MSDEAKTFCGLLVVAMLGFIIGIPIGGLIESRVTRSIRREGENLRQQAIEAGVARWTVDEKTGATKFEWIKKAEQP